MKTENSFASRSPSLKTAGLTSRAILFIVTRWTQDEFAIGMSWVANQRHFFFTTEFVKSNFPLPYVTITRSCGTRPIGSKENQDQFVSCAIFEAVGANVFRKFWLPLTLGRTKWHWLLTQDHARLVFKSEVQLRTRLVERSFDKIFHAPWQRKPLLAERCVRRATGEVF